MPFVRPEDARDAFKLEWFWLAGGLYLIWAVMTLIAWAFDLVSVGPGVLVGLAAGVLVCQGLFLVVFLRGWNRELRDPSLTLAQSIVGVLWVHLFMFFLPEWRDLTLTALPIVFMIGVLRLTQWELRIFVGISLLAYLAMTAVDLVSGHSGIATGGLLLRAAAVTSLLLWCGYYGSHVGKLRARLRARTERLEVAMAEARRLSETDALTQVANRRTIMESLAGLHRRAGEDCQPFSVLILDVDHFKAINDRYGHLAGDQVLTEFAHRVRSELRLLDDVAPRGHGARELGRFGGEEFIVALPNTDLAQAAKVAERLRNTIESHPFNDSLSLTVSIGVAEHGREDSIDTVIGRADAALYAAKADGRNCVRTRDIDEPVATETGSIVTRIGPEHTR